MDECYPVFWNKQVVGKVKLRKEGLYYSLEGQCKLTEKMVYRLYIKTNVQPQSLGILAPAQGYYTLKKHIPVKELNAGNVEFYLISERDRDNGCALNPEMEISYLSKLENAYFCKDGKVSRICFKNEGH